jgi:signal transduction histidine kinase
MTRRLQALPLRAKLTLLFALVMAVVLAAVGLFMQVRLRNDIDASIRSSLRARAGALAVSTRAHWPRRHGAIQTGERYAQIALPSGQVAVSRPEDDGPLLTPLEVARHVREPGFVERPERTRIYALPITVRGRRLVLVVAASLAQRESAIEGLGGALVIGGALALVLASAVAYGIAAGALRPVDAMRRRAERITQADYRAQLPVPPARDELGRLAETLNAMLRRLAETSEHERSFVANASHELRTPLTAMRAELELALRRTDDPERLAAAIRAALGDTERLSRLADDLLVLARADAGRLPVKRTRVDLPELVDRVVRLVPRGDRPLNVADDLPPTVEADELRLEQALRNMLENAVAHGAGPIVVGARLQGSELVARVHDDGPHLPRERLDHAFDRFVTDGAGGAGLGLAIVEAIARAHGGTAALANDPAGGVTVTISLADAAPRGAAARERAT